MDNNAFGEIYDLLRTKEKPQGFFIGDVVAIEKLKIMVNEMPLYEDNLYIPKHIGGMNNGNSVVLVKYNDQKYILLGVVR